MSDSSEFSARELAEVGVGKVQGDRERVVHGFASLDRAGSDDVTFAGPRHRDAARASLAGILVVATPLEGYSGTQILADDPNLAFARIVAFMVRARETVRWRGGIDPRAYVHPSADVHPEAVIRPLSVIDRGAKVAANAIVHPFAYVGENCVVGARSIVHPHAVLVRDVELAADVVVQSGAVLGSDGFGYATAPDGEHVKVPQVGRVVVEEGVEVGANTCVDRARFDVTLLGAGTKIDNLVQVAHNVRVGERSLLVAQVGIAGSTSLGKNNVLGARVGVAGHLALGDDVKVGAFSGVGDDLVGGASYFGVPAIPIAQGKRVLLGQARLPKLLETVRRLEARLAALERRVAPEESDR